MVHSCLFFLPGVGFGFFFVTGFAGGGSNILFCHVFVLVVFVFVGGCRRLILFLIASCCYCHGGGLCRSLLVLFVYFCLREGYLVVSLCSRRAGVIFVSLFVALLHFRVVAFLLSCLIAFLAIFFHCCISCLLVFLLSWFLALWLSCFLVFLHFKRALLKKGLILSEIR